MLVLRTGAVAPESVAVVVSAGSSGYDLSTVSAATLHVQSSNGNVATWSTVLSAQTAAGLTLTHTFSGGDLLVPDTVEIVAYMTVPGGTIRSRAIQALVKNVFDPS